MIDKEATRAPRLGSNNNINKEAVLETSTSVLWGAILNGLIACIVGLVLHFLLSPLAAVALVPVDILLPEPLATATRELVTFLVSFFLIYFVTFMSLMLGGDEKIKTRLRAATAE